MRTVNLVLIAIFIMFISCNFNKSKKEINDKTKNDSLAYLKAQQDSIRMCDSLEALKNKQNK